MKNESNEENIKFKKLSKAISIISKILKVFAIIGAITMLIVAIIVPYLLKRANIDENSISYNGTKIVEFDSEETKILEKNTEILSLLKKLTKDENVYKTITYYCVVECISLILLVFVFHYLDKLFKKFNIENTPFKLENVALVDKLAYSLLLYICIPIVLSGIFELITGNSLNFNWSIIEILFLLIIFAFRYIIEYGSSLEKK